MFRLRPVVEIEFNMLIFQGLANMRSWPATAGYEQPLSGRSEQLSNAVSDGSSHQRRGEVCAYWPDVHGAATPLASSRGPILYKVGRASTLRIRGRLPQVRNCPL